MFAFNSIRFGICLRSAMWPVAIACNTLLAVAVIVLGYDGDRRALAQSQRLQLIWVDFDRLPVHDRKLLHALAESCGLADVPMEFWPAVDCLERAAGDASVSVGPDRDPAEALHRLLDERSGPEPVPPLRPQPLT